jgi:hypothetical protein
MFKRLTAGRARERSARLHCEARNCLTLAIGERDERFAADLLDEAMTLARRARELAPAA